MSTQNLLLLHGALGSKGQMRKLEEKLSSKYTTHSLNFEGHGQNMAGSAFSIDLFTQNVFDFISDNNIDRTHIFGYSMGGYVALNFAIQYPSLVGKITTLGTKFDWKKETAEKEVKMLNPELIELKVPKFATHLKSVHHPDKWKAVLEKTAKMMLDLGNNSSLPLSEFRKIKHDVLIGIGDQDNMVSVEESQAVVNQLENGHLKVLPGFQHPIEKNSQDELANVIIDFMEGNSIVS